MGKMKEKLHTGELYLPGDAEIMKEQAGYQDLLCEYNQTETVGKGYISRLRFIPISAVITVILGNGSMPIII